MPCQLNSAAVPIAAYIGKRVCLLAVCEDCLNIAELDPEGLVQAHGKDFTAKDLENHLQCKRCNSGNARIHVSQLPDDSGQFGRSTLRASMLRHRILLLSTLIVGVISVFALGLISNKFLDVIHAPMPGRPPVAPISLDLSESVRNLQEEGVRLNAALAESTRRINSLERELAQIKEVEQRAKSETRSTLARHEAALQMARQQNAVLAAGIKKLKAARDEADRSSDVSLDAIATVRGQLANVIEEHTKVRRELKMENAALRKTLDRDDREIALLRKSLEEIKNQMPAGVIAETRSTLARHEAALQMARQQNAVLAAGIKKLKAARDEADRSSDVSLDAIATVRGQLANVIEEHTKVRRELKMENAALRKTLDRDDREIALLRKSLEEIKNQMPVDADSEEARGDGNSVSDGVAAYNAGDYAEAYRIWRDLAESGNARAQFHLGALYYEGRGVTKDLRKAQTWLRRALGNESSLARSFLKRVEDELQKRSAEGHVGD